MNNFFYDHILNECDYAMVFPLAVVSFLILLILFLCFAVLVALSEWKAGKDWVNNYNTHAVVLVICLISSILGVSLALIQGKVNKSYIREMKEQNINVQLDEYKEFTYDGIEYPSFTKTSLDHYIYVTMDDTDANFDGLLINYTRTYKDIVYNELKKSGRLAGFTVTMDMDLAKQIGCERLAKDFCKCLFITNINGIDIEPKDGADDEVLELYRACHERFRNSASSDTLTESSNSTNTASTTTNIANTSNSTNATSTTSNTTILDLATDLTLDYITDNLNKEITVLASDGYVKHILLDDSIKILPDTKSCIIYQDNEIIELHYTFPTADQSSSNTSVDVDVNVKVNQQ